MSQFVGCEDFIKRHKKVCRRIVSGMGTAGRIKLSFNEHQSNEKALLVVYGDFECLLKKTDTCSADSSKSFTTITHEHISCACAYNIKLAHMIWHLSFWFDNNLSRIFCERSANETANPERGNETFYYLHMPHL